MNVVNDFNEDYTDPNTGSYVMETGMRWLVERVSGRPLCDRLIEIVEVAGLAGNLHITCDREEVHLVDGGGCMTARDLARIGLLFSRGGAGCR